MVFDLGGVLIDFKHETYLTHIGFTEEDVKLFKKLVFVEKNGMNIILQRLMLKKQSKN